LDIDNLDISDTKPLSPKRNGSEPKAESRVALDEMTNAVEDDNLILTELSAKWQEIVSRMHKVRAAIATHLSFAKPISSRGKIITVAFSKSNCFHKELADTARNVRFIEEFIEKMINRNLGIKFVLSREEFDLPEGTSVSSEEPSQGDLAPDQDIDSDNEFVSELLDTFKGKIHTEE